MTELIVSPRVHPVSLSRRYFDQPLPSFLLISLNYRLLMLSPSLCKCMCVRDLSELCDHLWRLDKVASCVTHWHALSECNNNIHARTLEHTQTDINKKTILNQGYRTKLRVKALLVFFFCETSSDFQKAMFTVLLPRSNGFLIFPEHAAQLARLSFLLMTHLLFSFRWLLFILALNWRVKRS